MDVTDSAQVISRMKAAVASKQFGQEDILCRLIAEVDIANSAVVSSLPQSIRCPELQGICNTGMHPSLPKEPGQL